MRLTLLQKMVISFSLVSCLVIAGFGFGVLQSSERRYQEQSYAYCQKIVQANIALSDTYFAQLRNIGQIVTQDPDVVSAVYYREHNKQVDYAVELYNQRRVAAKLEQLDLLEGITGALIISSDGQYDYAWGASPTRDFDFSKERWYAQAAAQRQESFLNFHRTEYLLNRRKTTVSYMAPIWSGSPYFTQEIPYFLCDFDLASVLPSSMGSDDTEIAVYNDSEQVYFPGKETLSSGQLARLEEALAQGKKVEILPQDKENRGAYLTVSEKSKVSGWSIVGIMSLKSVERMRAANRTLVLGLMLVAFAVTLAASSLLARSVLVPMNRLIGAFEAIGRGQKWKDFTPTSSVEVDRIAHTADQMFKRIDRLSDQVMEEGKQRAQAQLRALQHQINPHFLNNVLQSMKALALCGKTETISKMCTLLGKLLSYSVYNPYDMVPLAEELSYTETYIALQNQRFEQKITCTLDCAEEAKWFLVPKLIIQPLAENAIEHGFSEGEGGHITLSADVEEEELCIVVTNTGMTLSAERVKELNRKIHTDSADERTASIGLLNVAERLKGCFGAGANLEMLARDGMNTSIVITIPIGKEKTDAPSNISR